MEVFLRSTSSSGKQEIFPGKKPNLIITIVPLVMCQHILQQKKTKRRALLYKQKQNRKLQGAFVLFSVIGGGEKNIALKKGFSMVTVFFFWSLNHLCDCWYK